MAAVVAGCDGWVVSDLHADSEAAATPEELKDVYSKWAESYDAELMANDYQGYKSVTQTAIDMLQSRSAGKPSDLVVMDAGCGTGLTGEHFKAEYTQGSVQLVGIDLSPEMLELASKKGCFDSLEAVDLTMPMTLPAGTFDLIISSGVFYPGHCGPEVLPGLLSVLKDDGIAVITVRKNYFDELQEDFKQFLDASGWSLKELKQMPYFNEIQGYVMVLTKM